MGNYESGQRALFEKMIAQGDVVYDIGANVGFYTLLAALLVGKNGRVIAFEPVPRNLYYLKKHLKMNHITTVNVVEKSVSNKNGSTLFCLGRNSAMGHVFSNWVDTPEDEYITVPMICLDDAIEGCNFPIPDCIKIDIEGAEMYALDGCKNMLKQYHPMIFLSVHSSDLRRECFTFLKSMKYNIDPIDNDNLDFAYEVLAYCEKDAK